MSVTDIVKGVDVSQHQGESLIDWGYARAELGIVFAYFRATYGTRADTKALLHCARMRVSGVTPGPYAFFLPREPIRAQVESVGAVADKARIGDGDLVPAVDVERYPDQWTNGRVTRWAEPDPTWCLKLQDFLGAIHDRFHAVPVVYLAQSVWVQLGRPAWLLDYPLWVPHWPAKGSTVLLDHPATPGNVPWKLWQNLVDPLDKLVRQDPTNPKAVDQDVARLPLPIIGGERHAAAPADPTLFPLELGPEETALMLSERNRAVAGQYSA